MFLRLELSTGTEGHSVREEGIFYLSLRDTGHTDAIRVFIKIYTSGRNGRGLRIQD